MMRFAPKKNHLLIGSVLLMSFMPFEKKPADTPPNVIIILMDDMGLGDPSCYNGILYSTPHIDQLAAQGMRFTDFYAAQPVCSASRAAILTGCYPNRVGIHGALMPWTNFALNPQEVTIAKALKKAGYHTGMIGKWHLGSQAPYLPIHYGFDEYLGLPYSNDMWPVDYNGKPITDTSDRRHRFPPLPLLEGDRPVKYVRNLEDQAQLTQIYTQRAKEFIRKNKKQPFFLYLAHSMVHVPIAASASFVGKSEEGLFGDVMTEVDWSVGEVMKTLQEEGIDQNTLVIFTSDNGPWLNFGDHAGNTGGLREGKGTSFEGGMRVPCIMRWPGHIAPGVICNKLSANIDLFPTLIQLCGGSLPDHKIDGINILSLINNDAGSNPRNELVYYYRTNDLRAIRKGRWKLVFPHRSQSNKTSPPGRNGYPAKTKQVEVPLALYDLRTDPGETVDLQSQHADIVKELEALADKYSRDLGDDLTGVPCTGCRPAAQVPVKER
jgi:arylsulfatase